MARLSITLVFHLVVATCMYAIGQQVVSQDKLADLTWRDVVTVQERKSGPEAPGCAPSGESIREVVDDFLSAEEVETLLQMMEKGMSRISSSGGPTILDINSGFMRGDNVFVNIYKAEKDVASVRFSKEEYQVYSDLFDRIKAKILELNGLEQLWFTAPTFVARLIGNPDWKPTHIHDEYWHPHVDKDNTDHYDYSGLVYLSTYGEDFTGGEFMFMDEDEGKEYRNTTVLPRKGRFITFTSGKENLHRVKPVLTGVRYTLSMWFTCDESRQFLKFLDGKAHASFKQQRDEL